MLLLILFVLFYIVIENRNTKVTVEELVNNYSIDRKRADKIYLDQDIELTGKFKSLLQSANGDIFIQMETMNDILKLFCIVDDSSLLGKVSSITSDTKVTILGKCLGLREDIFDSSLNSIYIQTQKIK